MFRSPNLGLLYRVVCSERLLPASSCLYAKHHSPLLARSLSSMDFKNRKMALSTFGAPCMIPWTAVSTSACTLKPREDIPTVADFKEKGLNVFPDLNESIKHAMNKIPSNATEFKQVAITNVPSLDQILDNVKRAMPDTYEIKTAPLPIFMIGCAGILPLVWPVWRFIVSGYILPGWEFFQLGYSACCISFLGGIRWGLILKESPIEMEDEAMLPTWQNLGLGLVPFSFAAMGMLMSPFFGYIMMISGYMTSAYIDLIHPGLPSWYRALHAILTVAAVSMLFLALLLKIFLRRQPELKNASKNNFN